MTTEGQNGPPPGWPEAPAPAAGEFGPGMTVVPDEPNYVPPGEAAAAYGSAPFGEVGPTKTYVEPFPAAQMHALPAYDPGPAYGQPMHVPSRGSSRAPLIVGALAIAVGVAGTIGFVTYRRQSAAESEESVPTIDVPKAKKKIAPADATAPAEPAATAAGPAPSAAPAATTEPTAAPPPSASPPVATSPQPTATVPPKPTATVPPKPTATAPPKPTATAPPAPTSTGKRRIPR